MTAISPPEIFVPPPQPRARYPHLEEGLPMLGVILKTLAPPVESLTNMEYLLGQLTS